MTSENVTALLAPHFLDGIERGVSEMKAWLEFKIRKTGSDLDVREDDKFDDLGIT
jgi:hypothetical protein